jgi:hypothetical protein
MTPENRKSELYDKTHSQPASRLGVSAGSASTGLNAAVWVILILVVLSLPGLAQVSVLTHHNDNSRTGQNLNETYLTPTSVDTKNFGVLFTQPVDGTVVAEPLYMQNLTINGATHNVVFVVTLNDGIYAFDADSNTGSNSSPLWYTSLINPPAVTTVPIADEGCGGATPFPIMGILGTPVIDPTTNTMYLVAKTLESGSFIFRLHAINITTGQDAMTPVVIQASYVSDGTTVTFFAQHRLQRPALLLSNGVIYIGFGNMGCKGPAQSTGWFMAYSESTLQQLAVLNVGPGQPAVPGIWMGGDGPSVDNNGDVYVSTGDGLFNYNVGGLDYGDTLMKLSLGSGDFFNVLDYFTPYNQASLYENDEDLGSSGAVMLPTQPGPNPNLAVIAGKGGVIYLVNTDDMGEYNSAADNVVEEIPFNNELNEIDGGAAYWNQNVYFGAGGSPIEAFSLNNGLLSTSPSFETTGKYNVPSLLSISANGEQNGVLWVVEQKYNSSGTPTGAVLCAFNALNLNLLYVSASPRDAMNPGLHLNIPMVANGKVYVGTQTDLTVFGLLTQIVGNEGNNQTGQAGTQLTIPLRAYVKSGYTGALLPGVTVNFSDGGNGGTFSNPSPVTNSKGVVLTYYTLPANPGTYALTATASGGGFTTARWTETATAPEAHATPSQVGQSVASRK